MFYLVKIFISTEHYPKYFIWVTNSDNKSYDKVYFTLNLYGQDQEVDDSGFRRLVTLKIK